MDNNAPNYIVNELLSYVFCYYDADSLNELRTTIDHFYTTDSVVSAKSLLWEHCSEQLLPKKNRTNIGAKTQKEKNHDDIMEAVKILDEETYDLPVEFCAVRLNNLPPRSKPRDTNDVTNRVTVLESPVAELLSQRKSYVPNFSEITGINERFQNNQNVLFCLRHPLKYHKICNLMMMALLQPSLIYCLLIRLKHLAIINM